LLRFPSNALQNLSTPTHTHTHTQNVFAY
jgi:hypothetical protein